MSTPEPMPTLEQLMPGLRRIAVVYAQRTGSVDHIDDYIQVAAIAVWRGLKRPAKDARHARNRAWHAARMAILDYWRAIGRLSRNDRRLVNAARMAQSQGASLSQAAKHVGVSTLHLQQLENLTVHDTDPFAHVTGDTETHIQLDLKRLAERLPQALQALPPAERHVITRLLDGTHPEMQVIAAELGISAARVSQLWHRAIALLLEQLGIQDAAPTKGSRSRSRSPPEIVAPLDPAVYLDLIRGPVPELTQE